MSAPSAVWRPRDPEQTQTYKFMHAVNLRFGLALKNYEELYEWSITSPAIFWDTIWDYAEIIGDKGPPGSPIVDESAPMSSTPPWFPEAKLNWAENMLRHRSATKVAIIQSIEPAINNWDPPRTKTTYLELYTKVSYVVNYLRSIGIQPGDRIASYATNCTENIIAALASIAIGAIWSSAATDFAPDAVIERFEQIKPRVIFSVEASTYREKMFPHIPKLREVVSGLEKLSIKPLKVVIIPLPRARGWPPMTREGWEESSDWLAWKDIIEIGAAEAKRDPTLKDISFWRGGFNHPIWILFSSGTTGKPKPIVHRAGGMLLQSAKELLICGDFKPEDVFFYYTTTGWMMWNFLVSALYTGVTLVVYDGSPIKPTVMRVLWRLIDDFKVTIFGTSAKYLEQDIPDTDYDRLFLHLTSLRMILSTGSPLASGEFSRIYDNYFTPLRSVQLASITGGTDICSLFAGMNTALPVYDGEIQCRMLGMSIRAYSDNGAPLPLGVSGDLVCDKHFPCQPLGFWPLEGYGESSDAVEKARTRYFESYYETVPGAWYHGDHVQITESKDNNAGGVIMLGRSDGILNPGGVRFGSAEIYSAISSWKIEETLVVGQTIQGGVDERVILFVKMGKREDYVFNDELVKEIKAMIRSKRSARHVPAKIIQVDDIPFTLNGKKVEVPVKKIINGAKKETLNLTTLRNPECLVEYERIGEELRAEVA